MRFDFDGPHYSLEVKLPCNTMDFDAFDDCHHFAKNMSLFHKKYATFR